MPSRLRQVSSTGAVTVVATSDVVPWRATVAAMRSSERAVRFHHVVAAGAVDVHVHESGDDRHSGRDVVDRVGRHADFIAMPERGDAAAFDDDDAVVDFLFRRQDPAGMYDGGLHRPHALP